MLQQKHVKKYVYVSSPAHCPSCSFHCQVYLCTVLFVACTQSINHLSLNILINTVYFKFLIACYMRYVHLCLL